MRQFIRRSKRDTKSPEVGRVMGRFMRILWHAMILVETGKSQTYMYDDD